MTRTHTYALLEVPGTVFATVKALLKRAGSEQAIHAPQGPGDKELLDMHGLALAAIEGSSKPVGMVEIGTILSHRDGHGRIEVSLNGELAQWDVRDAKKIHASLGEAIEAAISDELIFKFLTEKVHVAPEQAAMLLTEFRELRQGSKGTVNPS